MDYYTENTIALAFIGDAVYELYIREMLFEKISRQRPDQMHKAAVGYVKASAQCSAVKRLVNENLLTEDELSLVKRARNHKVATKAKNASMVEYKWATAFEALIGYLYLSKQEERLKEILKETLNETVSEKAEASK